MNPRAGRVVGAAGLGRQRIAADGRSRSSEDVGVVTDTPPDGFFESHDGLHAKTFVIDVDQNQSLVVTGSANLTTASWTRNVEFDAVLTGPTASCGVSATLQGSDEAPGLRQILEQYTVLAADGIADEAATTAFTLESFHRRLAAGQPMLDVEAVDDERVKATLMLDIPADTLVRRPSGWRRSEGPGETAGDTTRLERVSH